MSDCDWCGRSEKLFKTRAGKLCEQCFSKFNKTKDIFGLRCDFCSKKTEELKPMDINGITSDLCTNCYEIESVKKNEEMIK